MPRDYRRGGTAAYGPVRSGGVFAPAGNDLGDATLKARAAARAASGTSGKFTREHEAAYLAFAGIADRTTAVRLHRAGVTWDDVHAYTGHGIGTHDYNRMIRLAQHSLTPERYAQWAAFDLADSLLIFFAESGLTPGQVQPYLAARTRQTFGITTWREGYLKTVPRMIEVGLDADTSQAYLAHGIESASRQSSLHRHGATPAVVAGYLTHHPHVDAKALTTAYLQACTGCGSTAIAAAVFTLGGTAQDAIGWAATGETPVRIARFVLAGVTAQEWEADLGVRLADDEMLAAMAALRGHRVTVPSAAHGPGQAAGLVSA